jgi:hypothetical protein
MQRKGSRNSLEQVCDKAKQLLSQIKQPCEKSKAIPLSKALKSKVKGKSVRTDL